MQCSSAVQCSVNTEVQGRTVNTISQAELIFANGGLTLVYQSSAVQCSAVQCSAVQCSAGDHCYPEDLLFPAGVGAGLALSNRCRAVQYSAVQCTLAEG
jgi:hypothetical protein